MTYAEKIEQQKDRAAARADRRRDWAEGRRKQANVAFAQADRISSAIPLGQPILVGHHSEGHHRRDIDRIDGAMRRGVDSTKMANYHEERAEAAERRIARMEAPGTTLRRLEKLRANLRAMERDLATAPTQRNQEWYTPKMAEAREAIAYWEAHMADLEEQGVKVWRPADFAKGDVVTMRYGPARVDRVNAKSLSVYLLAADYLPECVRHYKLPYDEVKGKVTGSA